MEYGINIDFFRSKIGIEKAAPLIAQAGFTKLDYTPVRDSEQWENELCEAQKIFEANGLCPHQTHAPFNRYGKHGSNFLQYLDQTAEATERLGAKFMVIHGDEFDFENLTYSTERALAYNHDLFLPYVERAARNGYKIAFETVFEDWDRPRFSAKAEDLLALIRSFDSESAVCCWDFGHANIAFKKQAPEHIKTFGSLIQCTHLHDNTGRDSHQLPLTGVIDWKTTMDALRDTGYNGVLSVEYSHGNMPEYLAGEFIDLTYKTTKHVWEM